LGLNVRKNWIS